MWVKEKAWEDVQEIRFLDGEILRPLLEVLQESDELQVNKD